MGADYYAYVIIGLKYTDVITERQVIQTLTRYDEKTGEPYEKQETNILYDVGIIKGNKEWKAVLENYGLGYYNKTYESLPKNGVVGVRVPSCAINNNWSRVQDIEETSMSEFERSTINANRCFGAIGIKNTELKIYTVLYVSY